MDIAIVGPGAIGSLLIYTLNNAGIVPDVYVRDEGRLRHIRSVGGLRIVIRDEEVNLKANLKLPSDTSKTYDVVLVAVKAYDVEGALKTVSKVLRGDGLVLSFQNGIGPLELMERTFGYNRAGAAVITYGLFRYEYVTFLQGFGEVLIGQRSSNIHEDLHKVIDILSNGGLKVRYVDDIDRYRWYKLLINAGINPITAILQAPNKVIIESPEARELAIKTVNEGLKVVNKLGIELPGNPIEGLLNVAKKTGENYSSMLQDIVNNRETEIDYINGVIVKKGKELGIETPINTLLVSIIKGLVRWRKSLFQQ
ncbi:MAG: 2-dehydropantoate 2-reductase [Thermoprotei archaeon]|nr:MAG: 2-dehydropantoate 2-reductase [Thermoprotei archaeon]